MFVLIWAALLFSGGGTGASAELKTVCDRNFCISLNDGELTAEAGLCVMIPCSFSTPYYFQTISGVWFKCGDKCDESNIIFHSKNNQKPQLEFKGRVSLLDSNIHEQNCSIIINDLTASDSGSYRFRVNGYYHSISDRFSFTPRTTVTVKDLTQKPTVVVPPLTEGQQATLTCTAPGQCSGSVPEITWMWRGPGQNNSYVTENNTDLHSQNVSSSEQIHGSTLTFNASAAQHRTQVTCKVSFINNITTEETVTLNVTYVKQIEVIGKTRVKEGETLNLSCSLESFPPSLITWTKLTDKIIQNGTEADLQNDTVTQLQNNTETYPQDQSGTATLSISNVTSEDSGSYTCTAKRFNATVVETVNVTVIYLRKPVITGDTTVEQGHTLNLTCSIESFPPSHVTWSVSGSAMNLLDEPSAEIQIGGGSATLILHHARREHTGRYTCTVRHLDTTLTLSTEVNVTVFPQIMTKSGCEAQSGVLTCVCVSEGFPLPNIQWPLLRNHTMYSVTTTVVDHRVNSTVTVTVQDHSSSFVECVSSNTVGEAKENLSISEHMPVVKDKETGVFKYFPWLEVTIAFLIGALLSAMVCCLVAKYRGKKQSLGNLEEPVEMMNSQKDPLIDPHHAAQDDQTYSQDISEEAVVGDKEAPELDGEPSDVLYAKINFKRSPKSPTEVLRRKEPTDTVYSEIKVKAEREQEDNGSEKSEILEASEEKEEEGKEQEENEETYDCVPEVEKEEDTAVYSEVKKIVDEV